MSSSITASLTNLPDELALRILYFAGWRAAVKLGKTCRKFHSICNESTFWHWAVKDSFRVQVHNFSQDGDWRKAFKTLANGRLCGWGGDWNTLNMPTEIRYGLLDSNSYYPELVVGREYQGVVDVQSGGWSVSLLTLSGSVLIGGSLNGPTLWTANTPSVLHFHPPDTRIRQISCGRSHLLALSEGGDVWCVRGSRSTAIPTMLRFVSVDGALKDNSCKKIVAGWAASGALIRSGGIVLWFDDPPLQLSQHHGTRDDPRYFQEVNIIGVPYFSPYSWSSISPLGKLYEEDPVVDFAIGESYLVFVTMSGKVFFMHLQNLENNRETGPIQLLEFSAPPGQPRVDRVEGGFRRFAVFNRNGLVHFLDTDCLGQVQQNTGAAASSDLSVITTTNVSPEIVQGLDKHNVVDVAFGDWHCLALTDTGKVLSWGTESNSCGSLGIGPPEESEKRGVVRIANNDGQLQIPQVVSFDKHQGDSYSEGDSYKTVRYAYKISAAGWHSCALVAVAEEDSTLTAGGISQTVDGASDSKGQNSSTPPPPPQPSEPELPAPSKIPPCGIPHPIAGGDRREIVGMQSGARGGTGGLAEDTIARGGQSHFGTLSQTPTTNNPPPPSSQSSEPRLRPAPESGHRGGIVRMQSDARGGSGGMAEGTIARGGQSHFGMSSNASGVTQRSSECRKKQKEGDGWGSERG